MLTSSLQDIPVMRPRLPAFSALEPYIKQIDANGIYSNLGTLVQKLEQRLADFYSVNSEQVVTTANCTSGLQSVFLSVKKTGKYCIMPSWTFVATAHAAISAGLEPFFVDVDYANQQLSIHEVEEAIKTLGLGEIGAVCLVAPFGAPVNLGPWEALQEQTGIPVILDSAAAFATAKASKIVTCVSMHATKIMPAGEGGFVITPTAEMAKDIRARTNFGFSGSREALVIGGNAKLSEYHAAIALASLDDWPMRRRKFYDLCNKWVMMLKGMDGIAFEPGFGDQWFNSVAVARLSQPLGETLKSHLQSQGIYTRRWWGKGCHMMPAFSHFQRRELTVTHHLALSTIGLPCHFELLDADFDRMKEAVMSFLQIHHLPPVEWAA